MIVEWVALTAAGQPDADLGGSVMGLGPVILALMLGWLVTGLIWPYEPCPRCGGKPPRSPSGKYWRDCRKCGGVGKRERLAARVARRMVGYRGGPDGAFKPGRYPE